MKSRTGTTCVPFLFSIFSFFSQGLDSYWSPVGDMYNVTQSKKIWRKRIKARGQVGKLLETVLEVHDER